MSRPARILSKTGIYHIVFRGMNRQDIFEEERDYEKLLEIIEKAKKETFFELYGYCLMTNHVHLFLKENEQGDIKKIMHKILSVYVGWFNFKYRRSGSLIGNRYKSEPIEDDKYYLTLLRYIHQNPLKAGMVDKLKDYRWSSYISYIEGNNDVVDKAFALGMFHANEKRAVKRFAEFHEEFDDEDYEISEKIRFTDAQLRRKMQKVLNIEDLSSIKAMPKSERNKVISKLRESEFSIRQIERLTGISRGIICKIK